MNPVQFGEGGCEKARKYLDSYISNELLVETNHELLRHLEGCPACTAEVDARVQLRNRLRAAVKTQTAPPDLQVRIRQRIQQQESRGWLGAGWTRWAAATAASVIVGVGLWVNFAPEKMPALTDRPAQNVYIQKVSAKLAAVLRVGLGDHIHCSVFRKYPKNPPTVDHMEEALGAQYKGLLPVVRTAIPEGYRIIMAHQCGYAGRRYVHLTLEKDGSLLSLVIARKNPGETLEGLSETSNSPVPIYQSDAGRYHVAGFDAGEFLAYVVSDSNAKTNLNVAEAIAPGVREFLLKG